MMVLGVTDQAVIAFSSFFFFLLVTAVFLLGRKLFGNLVGALSALAVLTNLNYLDYATSGASETLFAFEIVIGAYLLILRRKGATISAFLVMLMMYFSRPQAFIFIAGLVFLWFLLRVGFKKGLLGLLGLGILGLVVDKFIIYPLSFKYPVTPVFIRGLQSILTYSSAMAVSDSLRGGAISTLTYLAVFKKVFYNLYNFYKALPAIANPYLWGLFFIGLFWWGKDKTTNSFRASVVFMTLVTFLVTALTIPFYRYLHPIVPPVYIFGVATLVEIVSKLAKPKYQTFFSLILVLFFVVGQSLGAIFLDPRFTDKLVNRDKPPVYVVLSRKLKEITKPTDIILTNLDTWGSWYGERKTVWFPLTPVVVGGRSFDAIYLTSYKMDDENYLMGREWREIFVNPTNQKILPGYKLAGEYFFEPYENYERQAARAVLLTKKQVE